METKLPPMHRRITAAEAAKILKVSKTTLFRWEKQGKITGYRVYPYSQRLYDKNDLVETVQIIELIQLEEKHFKKLIEIRQDGFSVLLFSSINDSDSEAAALYISGKEERWVSEHKKILKKLLKYPYEKIASFTKVPLDEML